MSLFGRNIMINYLREIYALTKRHSSQVISFVLLEYLERSGDVYLFEVDRDL